jgi:hypothetical protein|tara:strand:+ start:1085 stop:1540 length:456 start_codon:yes stop_codon:yes gene_type:complete
MKVMLSAKEANVLLVMQLDKGFSNSSMAKHLGVSPGVWSRAMDGHKVRVSSYKKLTQPAVMKDPVDDQMGRAHDMVNSPSHYADSEIECIDAMVAAFGLDRVQDYSEIAAFKYQWRCGKKLYNDANQDKAKSVWYLRYSMGDDPREDQYGF